MAKNWLNRQYGKLRDTWQAKPDYDKALEDLRGRLPAPTFWLLGKTQSGKSSLVKYLTGASAAEVGNGFRPCTRTTNEYPFPSEKAPVVTFLDTRGLDDPNYQPDEDLLKLDARANVMVVTARLCDPAQGTVRASLAAARKANPTRPVLLALTCLHEATGTDAHAEPYPYDGTGLLPEKVQPYWDQQRAAFAGLYDACVAMDITKPEEGFANTEYGGEQLKSALIRLLPNAYRQTLIQFEEARKAFQDAAVSSSIPIISAYATAAASAAAVPVPFISFVTIPAIQTQMIRHLAQSHGQTVTRELYKELAAAVGVGLLSRQLAAEAGKLIPLLGSVAAASVAGGSTYALGRAFVEYLHRMKDGHVPQSGELKAFYQDELSKAQSFWKKTQ